MPRPFRLSAVLPFLPAALLAAGPVRPLKVLLVTGGCCHDYATQKEILKKGLEARANIEVTQVHVNDESTRPKLPILGNPGYAAGYDVVIHDECAADVSDPKLIDGVLRPHRDGVPAVILHCAVHSYRIGDPRVPAKPGESRGAWFDLIGIQSSGHGAQKPITVAFATPRAPWLAGLSDWTTGPEELYNNVRVADTVTPLASGRQGADTAVTVWTNRYAGKTRVFGTTLGHNNATVADARYLDLVTRGVLWAADKLEEKARPRPGCDAPAESEGGRKAEPGE